ncbi:MAG: N-acetylmuramoyl-L-alanine amidase [Meiothermus sp.]|uniref:N-acetylmuramoyl-L-alanine amidase family protein n=1 Tax=Meiothermus sp. TaxID=1955249 RepID=UPI00298ED131|nr:N-acetylmuramoyl-L-alanine amidase [Meiothermus sp.]MDW8426308.1 N-acetylmuramoyl-L-alanine amidase [Meiothermus sp.]
MIWLGLGWAQYENRLLVGFQETQAIYPGGGSVAFGPARFIAEALGLGYLEASGKVYLSLGSRVAVFGISSQGADAARLLNAYRYQGGLWVPVRELARNLDLYYRNDYGAPVLALRPARLLEVQRAVVGSSERYILRFDRDVQVRLLANNPPRLALIGVREVPEAPPNSAISFSREDWGTEIYLPQGNDPPRLLFLPRQVMVERGAQSRLPRVVLDAGHGGADSGVVVGGLQEKDLVLSVSQRLQKLLQGRLEVILTRNADRAVPLLARAQYASSAQVFISLHAAAGNRITVYSHPEIQTLRLLEKGRELSARTPASQRALLERYVAAPGSAARFAQAVAEGFAAAGMVANPSQDAMYVLSMAGGAAILVEVGFEQLRTPQGREQVAEVLARAVFSYLGLPEATPPTNPNAPGGNRP